MDARTATSRLLPALAALLLVGLFVACGKQKPVRDDNAREAAIQEMFTQLESINAVFAGVEDLPTAREAAPRLRELSEKLAQTTAVIHALDEPEAAEGERLSKLYSDRLTELTGAVIGHMVRISMDPELSRALEEEIMLLGEAFGDGIEGEDGETEVYPELPPGGMPDDHAL